MYVSSCIGYYQDEIALEYALEEKRESGKSKLTRITIVDDSEDENGDGKGFPPKPNPNVTFALTNPYSN
jgi:hypothetical protein